MPTFGSNGGKWFPAKEKVGLINHSKKTIMVDGKQVGPGEPFIYEGPDRAALYYLWEESGKPTDPKKAMTSLGTYFKDDPEYIGLIRQKYNMTVEDYLKMINFDEENAKKEFDENFVKVTSHQVVARGKEIETQGGGVEFGTGKVIATGAIGDVKMPV